MEKITDNLVLLSIESNNWRHDEEGREITTCWELHFDFFGQSGFVAYITDECITKEYPSFAMIESDFGDLHESFIERLEENWEKLIVSCKIFEARKFIEESKLAGIPV